MNNLNSTLLEGVIENDPEFQTTEAGDKIAIFSIKSIRYYKDSNYKIKEEVGYFDVEVKGDALKKCEEKGKKGIKLRVVGRLKQERATTDGISYNRILIIAEHVEFERQK